MNPRDNDFFVQLRETFRVEAGEHLQAIASGLLELERSPDRDHQRSIVETIFRAAHSLKGAARAVDFTEIESICQSLEDDFTRWKLQTTSISRGSCDAAHHAINAIAAALTLEGGVLSPDSGGAMSASQPVPPARVEASEGPARTAAVPFETERSAAGHSVRIPVAKLEAQLTQAEELLTAKLTAYRRTGELRKLAGWFDAWRKELSIVEPEARLARRMLDRQAAGEARHPDYRGIPKLLEFLDWTTDQLLSFERRVAALTNGAEQDQHIVGKLVDELLEDSKKLLLLPFSTITAPFPKLVRDLCSDQGKEADLIIRGEDVEIDKRILEEIKDPLIHLLRNAVDHGVELPEIRIRMGKPPRAIITLEASPVNGSKVEIRVSDDGSGLSMNRVKESAVTQGWLSSAESGDVGEKDAWPLVFMPEVTTSPIITRVSGRGLGLAIVKEKAEKLGGDVSVESRSGEGTQFRMILPSVLASFRGILVESAGKRFVIPTVHVDRAARFKIEEVQTVEGRDTIVLDSHTVVLARLESVLETGESEQRRIPRTHETAILLGSADERIAFVVDAVLEEQEVLVKRLVKPLVRVRNVAGVAVLASGQIALILNVSDLLRSARIRTKSVVSHSPQPSVPSQKSILVVEDSITSRMLIKAILESAGYQITTAVDGMEAYTLLRSESFDLVVSDVEMPRLNGFDLTAKIRSDSRLADLPVILVTALETREDRERGIEAGANAYIIKSSFSQVNLLEAVRRLV